MTHLYGVVLSATIVGWVAGLGLVCTFVCFKAIDWEHASDAPFSSVACMMVAPCIALVFYILVIASFALVVKEPYNYCLSEDIGRYLMTSPMIGPGPALIKAAFAVTIIGLLWLAMLMGRSCCNSSDGGARVGTGYGAVAIVFVN
jgi:uncharacterized membrane protein